MKFFNRGALCAVLAFACVAHATPAQERAAARRGEGRNRGLTPLMRAAERGRITTVRTLLRNGVEVNEQDSSGRTALWLAASAGRLEVVKSLLAAGADPNAKAFSFHAGEQSVLVAALRLGVDKGAAVVDVLAAAGAELNPKDAQVTPLMFAVNRRDLRMVEALLSRGADVNGKNYQGLTPLMAAVLAGSPEAVSLLISKGADANAQDAGGRTALSLAEEVRGEFGLPQHAEIVRILKAAATRNH